MIDGLTLRPATAGDLNYIYATLLRDLRDSDPSGLPDELWFPPHRAWLDHTLADPAVRVTIAAATDKPSEILGYVIAEPQEVLEWVHVRKGPLRGKGIAKLLLVEAHCPPEVPSRWQTRLSRQRLANPCRSRLLRRGRAAPSTALRSTSSTR